VYQWQRVRTKRGSAVFGYQVKELERFGVVEFDKNM